LVGDYRGRQGHKGNHERTLEAVADLKLPRASQKSDDQALGAEYEKQTGRKVSRSAPRKKEHQPGERKTAS